MEIKDTFNIRQDKGAKKKTKCSLFFNKILNRELAVHEDIDRASSSAVSDVITGTQFFSISTPIKNITMEQITIRLDKFIAHFTADGILEKLREFESNS